MQYRLSQLFIVTCFFSFYVCAQEIRVYDDLSSYDKRLQKEKFALVVHCNAFTSQYGSLEEAAKKGAHVQCVVKKAYLSKYYDNQVSSKQKNLSLAYAHLHDKLAVLKKKGGPFEGYMGSAALSKNALEHNAEIVLHLPNVEALPGFTKHVEKLLGVATSYKSKSKQNIRLPKGPVSSRRNRRDSSAGAELISCFEFDSNYTLVSWMADRIKVNEKREYYISSMNLDHPVFIERVRQAVQSGSTFSIVVNKKNSAGPLVELAQLVKNYPDKVELVWKKGRKSGSGIHHAKLFVRSPDSNNEGGLTIVPTANFTKKGGIEHNCALSLPHSSVSEDTIHDLMEKFCLWWEPAKAVSGKEVGESSKDKEKKSAVLVDCATFLKNNPVKDDEGKDYIFIGLDAKKPKKVDYLAETMGKCISTKEKGSYCLITGCCNKKDLVSRIEKALKKGSTFKVILPKKSSDSSKVILPKMFSSLAKKYPGSIEIKVKNGTIKYTTLIYDTGSKSSVFVCKGSLAYQADQHCRPGIQLTGKNEVKETLVDFEKIWNKSIEV